MPGPATTGSPPYAGGVSRWTGSWLPGSDPGTPEQDPQRWPGERLGLPERGPGSAASNGIRFGALLIDLVLASLATSVFVPFDVGDPAVMRTHNLWSGAVWFLITVAGVALAGFTPGKALLGLRVVRLDGTALVGPLRAIPRTILVGLILPGAITDQDGRGLQDKAVGTSVLRTR